MLKPPPNIELTDFACRYWMAVRVIDISSVGKTNAPVAEFVFFGDIGQESVGIPALTLTTSAPTVTGFVPPEITRLYGTL